MRRLLFPALLTAAACGPVSAPSARVPHEVVRDAILGGRNDPGDSNVFMLMIQADNGQGSLCTATLIDTHTLLTAAHCVDPSLLQATSVTIYATSATSESGAQPGVNMWQVAETRTHPDWNINTLDGDLALALLPKAMTITPKPWSGLAMEPYKGLPVRAVGYGTNTTTGGANDPMGAGQRRQVDLTLRDLDARNLYLGDQVSRGICHGDSGGPTFMVLGDGIERQIGVHSYTLEQTCLDGADQRLDTNLPFLQKWLQEKEAPSCNEDGRCVPGCAQPDLDCVCAKDGVCNPECPDLAKDKDCPPDCGPNGVCSAQACPLPDRDCVMERLACSAAEECASRKCLADATHPAYCTTGCIRDADCAQDMRCDTGQGACLYQQLNQVPAGAACTVGLNVCSSGTVCTGPAAGATWCAPNCRAQLDCRQGETCEAGFDGQKHCHLPTTALPLALEEGPVAAGCSSTGGLGTLALLALLGLARRRTA